MRAAAYKLASARSPWARRTRSAGRLPGDGCHRDNRLIEMILGAVTLHMLGATHLPLYLMH